MVKILLFLPCVAYISTALASPIKQRSAFAIKDTINVPRGWSRLDTPLSDHTVRLQIGLKQHRFDELRTQLYQVSDPDHERYGQHLTSAEVDDLVRPSTSAMDHVHEWLADHGIGLDQLSYSRARDWIAVSLPVETIEQMLDTKYYTFEHTDNGDKIVRAPVWSLPVHLHEHIATIQPTNSFFQPKAKKSTVMRPPFEAAHGRPIMSSGNWPSWAQPVESKPDAASVAAACNTSLITPLCLRTLYGTVNYTAQSAGKNQMALNDFLGEVNNRSDISIFLNMYRPEAVAAAYQFQQISIDGGTLQQTPENATDLFVVGLEGNLDAETMLGIAWPTPLTAYSTGGLNPEFVPDLFTTYDSDEPYLAWVNYVLTLPSIPQVISTSYGDDEQTVSYDYATHVCNQFAQLGARGVSVMFASGDEGVGADGCCFTNDGRNASTFLPAFPGSCPYVTTVGATQGLNPEVAAYDGRFRIPFTSGGGFSNYFPRPAYQARVVSDYLSQHIGNEFAGLYNVSGRGYPDIAAQGVNFSTIYDGRVVRLDGTSASTPAASSVIALVNDALIAAGRPTLGFLNPWLYSRGYRAFTDVVSGSSAGCGTTGFPAAKGWDAVTGFGTPYFPNILASLGLGEWKTGPWYGPWGQEQQGRNS